MVNGNGTNQEDKTMKSRMREFEKYLFAAFFVIAAAAFFSCSNDNDDIEEPKQPAGEKTYTLTVQATKGDDVANSRETRALAVDGNTLNATWAIGERVTVYNKTKSAAIDGYLAATSNGATTTLSGSLTGTIESGDVLTLKFLSPDYTGQDGTLAYIAAHCDYAEAEVTVSDITDSKITTGTANFSNKQAIVKFTVIDKTDGTTKLNPSVFNIYVPYLTPNKIQLTIPASTYTTNGDGVIYVAIPGVYNKKVTIIASANSKTYAYIKYIQDNWLFREGMYYAVNLKMTNVEGLFTSYSDASVHQIVTFSPGNLRATTTDLGANWTWSFAPHQYDFIGNAAANTLINGNGTVSANGTVDLFGWSTSSTYYGINPSSTDGDYSGAFVDWGGLAIDSYAANTWRTLTVNEWNFIFNKRSAATINGVADARYTKATITIGNKSVKGVILFPDFYAAGTPDGVAWGDFNTPGASFATSCTEQGWGVLEAYGCVFLPSGGYRNGVSIDMSENYGGYWSASSGTTGTQISYLYFRDNNTNPWSEDYRHRGHSVRLVKNFNF